jgi:IclR family acetate operon transcriptional repressor
VTDDKTGQVRSVTRALTLLRTLANSANGMSLSETAVEAGLAASTAHRILTTLESEHFVRFDQSDNLWRIGVDAFTTGAAFVRTRDVIGLTRPYLRRLMEQTGETANVFLETGGEVICMEQVESRHSMRAITRVGGKVRMHCSGAGKAILAFMSDDARDKILAHHGLPRETSTTITDRAALDCALSRIRARGYAVDDGENAEGIRCVAAPVLNETGVPAAAISVSGPAARIDDAKLAQLGVLVSTVASEVTRSFGGCDPRTLALAANS